jgi:hypothetical protein
MRPHDEPGQGYHGPSFEIIITIMHTNYSHGKYPPHLHEAPDRVATQPVILAHIVSDHDDAFLLGIFVFQGSHDHVIVGTLLYINIE